MKSDNRRLTFAARPARAANGGSHGAVAGVKNTNQASISIEVRRNKINMLLTLSRGTSHWNFQSAREKDTRGIRIKTQGRGCLYAQIQLATWSTKKSHSRTASATRTVRGGCGT